MTGMHGIVIPAGVTIASGRGRAGRKGALIYTNENRPTTASERFHLFETGGNKVRITGLRIMGPDSERRKSAYEFLNSDGIYSLHDSLEVDNCELSAWSHGGVFLKKVKHA